MPITDSKAPRPSSPLTSGTHTVDALTVGELTVGTTTTVTETKLQVEDPVVVCGSGLTGDTKVAGVVWEHDADTTPAYSGFLRDPTSKKLYAVEDLKVTPETATEAQMQTAAGPMYASQLEAIDMGCGGAAPRPTVSGVKGDRWSMTGRSVQKCGPGQTHAYCHMAQNNKVYGGTATHAMSAIDTSTMDTTSQSAGISSFVQRDGTAGTFSALKVTTSDKKAAVDVVGLDCDPGISPIKQSQGSSTFVNPTFATLQAIDVLTSITSTTTAILVAGDDELIIGYSSAFNLIALDTTTPTSLTEYSLNCQFFFWNGGGWTTFEPLDSTMGFLTSGNVSWKDSQVTGWVADGGVFKVKIQRQTPTAVSSGVTINPVKLGITSAEYSWDADGKITTSQLSLTSQPVHVRRMNANQTISDSVTTTIVFGTSLVDQGGITYSSGVFTLPSSGIYKVDVTVLIDAASAYRILPILFKNTSTQLIGYDTNTVAQAGSEQYRIHVSQVFELNATDTVRFTILHFAGSNQDVVDLGASDGRSGFFSIVKLF